MRYVAVGPKKQIQVFLRNGFVPVACAFVFSLMGCNGKSGVEAFCAEIPNARFEIASIRGEVTPFIAPARPAGRRMPASEKSELPVPSEESLSSWLDWTESALKRTQNARDALEGEKAGRKSMTALGEATLSLVSIHGFIEQKKWKKVALELDKVERSLKRATDAACEVPPVAAAPTTPKRAPASQKTKKKKK
jgi:hypothetical protein